jgi:glycerophosphoryl diester phosphodiesterase
MMVACASLGFLGSARVTSAGGYYSAVTGTPGLRHFWHLDEPGTPAVSVDSVGGKTATHASGFPTNAAAGGPSSTPGPRPADGFAGMPVDNAALLYTPAGKTRSFVSSPDLVGGKSFTAGDMHGLSTTFWFKRTTVTQEGVLVGYNDRTGARYGFTAAMLNDASTSIRELKPHVKDMEERQTAYNLGATPDLLWHHLAMTWDGRNLRTYLDGAETAASVANSAGAASGPLQPLDELVFGGDASTMDMRYLNGALDLVAIYDRPLTNAQVARHYRSALTGGSGTPAPYEQTLMELSPCHYWRMEESRGRILDSISDWSLTPRTIPMDWADSGIRPPAFMGLEANNCAAGFRAADGNGLYNTNATVVDALTPTNRFSAGTVDRLSLSVWFRLSETGSDTSRQIIAGFQRNTGNRYTFLVCRENTGALQCYVTDNSGESQLIVSPYPAMTDSAWHNFAMAWDGAVLRTWLDGGNEKSYSNVNVSGAIRTSDGFYLGMDANGGNRFDGQLDEVALFGDALTGEQVERLYTAAVRGKPPQGTLIRLGRSGGQAPPCAMPERGVCAHRGAMATHPENTLAAFQEAVRLGAHMIEFDINLTKDERIVLMHDPTVDRTTDGSGRVTDLTFEEIRRLDAGAWKGTRFSGERVPTLEETLSMMPVNIWLNVHTKGNERLAVMAAREIVRQGRAHQAFLATERAPATAARAACPDVLICNMQNQSHGSAYVTDTIRHGDAFLQLYGQPAAPQDMARLKAAGVRINCFLPNHEPDTPEELTDLFEAGVEFPLVDDVGPMLEAARQLGIEPLVPEYRAASAPDTREVKAAGIKGGKRGESETA